MEGWNPVKKVNTWLITNITNYKMTRNNGILVLILSHTNVLNSLNRLTAPKENSTNLEFSMCDTRPPQKKSYDVVNGLALFLTSDDLG